MIKCDKISAMKNSNSIFKFYAWMINTIRLVSIRISPKLRDVVMNLSLLMLSFIGIAKYLNDRAKHLLHYHKNTAILLGCICLMLLLVASVDRGIDYKRFKCRPGFVIGWLICFGMAFALTFIHPVTKGYFLWAVMSLLFAIPFAMIWNERNDFDHLCDMLAKSVFLVSTIFCLMNLLVVPFINNSAFPIYLGLVSNSNNNGFVSTAGYIAALYLLTHNRRVYVIYAVMMGFCIAISSASACRTAEITIVATTLTGLLYFLQVKRNKCEQIAYNYNKLAVSLVLIIAIAISGKYALLKIDHMDLNAYAYEGEETVADVVQEPDLATKLNYISSGRIEIWKAYIENSTFWGNGNKTKGPQIAGVEASKYAHNNAIEVLFVSGFIAFAGYVTWIISGLVFVVRCLMGKYGWHKSYIMVVMAFTGYFIQAMLEILIYPMNNIPAMMMYVCLMPIILDTREEDTVE